MFLPYDPDRRVPFFANPAFVRDEFHWWAQNTGQGSRLWLNGNLTSTETGGSYDIEMLPAWNLQARADGVKVGVVDNPGNHGARIFDILQIIAPGVDIHNYPVSPYYGISEVSAGILHLVNSGVRIIVLPWGTPENSIELLTACSLASSKNVVMCCSLPNAEQNIDVTPDYPASWNLPNVVPISSLDRQGNRYIPSASSTSTLITFAPGRNIVAAGTYSSGTSYAAPIVAGVAALVRAKSSRRNITEALRMPIFSARLALERA